MWLPVQDDAAGVLTGPGDSPAKAQLVSSIQQATIPAADALDDWEQHFYTMTQTGAAKLGFTVGEVSASGSVKIVVAETARSTTVDGTDGRQLRYGVALRLVIRAESSEGAADFNLPMIAAEAQFGRIKTESHLNVRGYVGPKLAKLMPEWTEFDVEGYVAMKQSITEIQRLIMEDTANVRPRLLHVFDPAGQILTDEQDRERAIGIVWALTRILDGDSADEAVNKFPLKDAPGALDGLRETYREMTGQETGKTRPTQATKSKAREELGTGLRLGGGWLASQMS